MISRTNSFRLAVILGCATALQAASISGFADSRIEVLQMSASSTTIDIQLGQSLQPVLKDGLATFELDGFDTMLLDGEYMLPIASTLYEIPATGNLQLVVEELSSDFIPNALPALGSEDESGEIRRASNLMQTAETLSNYGGLFREHFHLGQPAILRDLRLSGLSIQPIRVVDGGLEVMRHARIRIDYGQGELGGNELHGQHSWSQSMEQMYKGLVPNHGQFYNSEDDSEFPVYMITGSDAYLNMSVIGEFVAWKRRKGFNVQLAPFSSIPGGNTNTISNIDLQTWSEAVWDEFRPEVLLLIGDEDGVQACPTAHVQSSFGEQDVTDHMYALQEGEDYLPELLVGRFSIDNLQQLFTVARKPVVHETQTPLGTEPCEWHQTALIVSCNYADNGNAPISPNLTSRWVIDKLRANDFCVDSGDSLFYPPLADGGPPIQSAIDMGRNIVNYRGWANSNGWVFPAFDRIDIDQLSNGFRMPIVASFVCQTGAFGGDGVEDPCFGEKFVQFGSPQSMGGAVAFVGPSDLHTRTQFNNPVCSGFYNAIFDLGLTSIGSALLNGKMELYRGYPLIREDPFGAFFYFHVYGVLGDPDLKIWRNTPKQMDVQSLSTLALGEHSLEVRLTGDDDGPLANAIITVVSGSNNVNLLARGRTDETGRVMLELNLSSSEALTITANHIDYLPGTQSVTVDESAEVASLQETRIEQEVADAVIRAGETLTLFPSLHNNGTASLSGLSATIDANDNFYEILDGSAAWNDLGAGATAESADGLQIRLKNNVAEGQLVPAIVRVTGGGDPLVVVQLDVRNKTIEVMQTTLASTADHVNPGVQDELVLQVKAAGIAGIAQGTAELISGSDRLIVQDTDPVAFGDLDLESQTELRFTVAGGLSLFQGQQVLLELLVRDEQGFEGRFSVTLPNGTTVNSVPMGPDQHGYYAIENSDFGIQGHPEYDWKELDPAYGGHFDERLYLIDDDVTVVDLPFPVTYYGQEYNQISVCSNGWVSMGETWMANFRNWNIPSSLGPSDMICVWWDDLKPMYTENGDSTFVPVFTRYDSEDEAFVVSWSRSYSRFNWTSPGQPLQEFQLIFKDRDTAGDNELLMQYKGVTNIDFDNNYATVGLTNFAHNDGLEITYANHHNSASLIPGQGSAILFSTAVPINDVSVTVDVSWPAANDWFTPDNSLVQWDHEALMTRLSATSIEYTLELLDINFESLHAATITDLGQYDLADVLGTLPEGEGLQLRLQAVADLGGNSISVSALQGLIPVGLDRTEPRLGMAVLQNGLFQNQLELGIHCSENMSSVLAFAHAGETVAPMELIPGSAALSNGQEIYYLNLQLDEQLTSIVVQAVDAHGVSTEMEMNLVVITTAAGEGQAQLPDASVQLSWQGSVAGTRALLDLKRLASSGFAVHPVLVQTPSGRPAELRMGALDGHRLAYLKNGQWTSLEHVIQDGTLVARISEGGVYALVPSTQIEALPSQFKLFANWPNPFNPSTRIRFDLTDAAFTRLAIYNLLGEQVRVIHSGELIAGTHTMTWDGRDAQGIAQASGVYFARLQASSQLATIKMVLLR